MKLVCQVFKSSRKQEMYLYVEKSRGLQDIPDALMAQFGEPTPVMVLILTPEKNLARASAAAVLADIEAQGFYLQMPPTAAELLAQDNGRG
jgi:uncharacterized protein YcgL (UPF0745 family)